MIIKCAEKSIKLPLSHIKEDYKEFESIRSDAKKIDKKIDALEADDKKALKNAK